MHTFPEPSEMKPDTLQPVRHATLLLTALKDGLIPGVTVDTAKQFPNRLALREFAVTQGQIIKAEQVSLWPDCVSFEIGDGARYAAFFNEMVPVT